MFCLSMLTIAMMPFVHATNNLHFNISFHNNTDTEVFGNTFRCDSNASTIYTTDTTIAKIRDIKRLLQFSSTS